jgi:hypothetical protein
MSKSAFHVVTLGALLLTFGLAMTVSAQTVNVTFRVNTSTNLDTLSTDGVVQLRGAILLGDGSTTQEGDILPGGNNISWSSASDLILQNVGGDYWQGTFEFNANDTINFKIWTGFDLDNGTAPDGGWEGAFNPSEGLNRDTRVVIIGEADTTLPLMYYNPNVGQARDTYFRPFETKPDSIAIHFRVNMAGVIQDETFDPFIGSVGIRGNDQTSGGVLNWGATNVILTREENNIKGDPFWSGYVFFPKDSLTVNSTQAYKFFMQAGAVGDQWETSPDRTFRYTENLVNVAGDTTLHWVYFSNKAPVQGVLVDANVTFRVSTAALEDLGLFDSALGDSIHVIGPKGWDVTVGLPTSFIRMNFTPLLREWTVSEPFRKFPGDEIIFKYFVRWDPSRVDPASPNFIPNLVIRGLNNDNDDSGWEEPGVTGGADRRYTYTSDVIQAVPGDFGFPLNFFNSIPGNGVIKEPITITWNVNMAPAADPVTNPNTHLFTPGTDSVWVQPDGSIFALTQGFPTVGARMVLLKDDDGDMIYSGSFTTTKAAPYQIEYVIAYGTTGNIVTNGQSVQFGRRYYQFIHPTNIANDDDLTTTWPSEFNLPTVDWLAGVANGAPLTVETPPDLTTPTSVEGEDILPFSFALQQNYPNPFNPQTTISYQVPVTSDVKVEVYNLKGQLVRTLVDQRVNQGRYTVVWNGDNSSGQIVSSGVYFVKMTAGKFKQVRKMTLVR